MKTSCGRGTGIAGHEKLSAKITYFPTPTPASKTLGHERCSSLEPIDGMIRTGSIARRTCSPKGRFWHFTMSGMSIVDHNDLVSAWESEQSRVIRNFVRGESRCLFSSAGLGWPGIMLEEHKIASKSRPAPELSRLVLCFWNNNETMRCDHPDANGYFVPKLVHPGTLSLYTRGALAEVRTFELWSGIFLSFKEGFLCEVEERFHMTATYIAWRMG